MLASLVPMFKKDMSVAAYCLFAQKENLFANPHLLGSGRYDGAGNIVGIEVLNNVHIETLSKDSLIIVPVNNISVFADISSQFVGPKDRIMLLLDSTIKPEETYNNRLLELKAEGYKLAMRKMQVNEVDKYRFMLDNFDILFIDCNYADPIKQAMFYRKFIPNIVLGVENVKDQEQFDELVASNYFVIFEGDFYRVPVSKQETEVSPLKANYLSLLSEINKPDFELTTAADIISKDPGLTISLLNVVNKLTVNSNISSIKQATAMLGQKELKRWINTSVMSNLCADKPNEVTRLSLIRAKFAENLASQFELSMKVEEIFLMGLFSVLDIVLDKSMAEALSSVNVSKDIFAALVNSEGPLAGLLDFELAYEAADWQEVSRQMVLYKMNMDDIYDAYVDALKWYKNMFL